MCDSHFLTLHFVVNKVDVSYDVSVLREKTFTNR